MADRNAQRRHGHPRQPGRYAPEGNHSPRPPARSRAMEPAQPGDAAYAEPLTHHAPVRSHPRRALLVRRWYAKKRFVLPLAALVASGVIIGIGGAGSSTPAPVAGVPVASTAAGSAEINEPVAVPTTQPAQKAAKKAVKKAVKKAAAGIGESVEAGDWQFEVIDFDCGEKEVGDGDRSTEAEGEWCVLEISAKNNSDAEGIVSGDSQKLSADDGTTWTSDLKASLADDPDSNLLLDGVDPGKTAKGTVVFDVPKKVKITGVTLTGGGSSDGKAEVSLR